MDELVSVIIPTHGRGIDIQRRAIASVRDQTYKNIEIILVDDNLPDTPCRANLSLLREEFPGLVILETGGNKGAPVARNLGIRAAKGTLVSFLDDDDEYLPEKIAKQAEALTDGVGAVATAFWRIRTDTCAKTLCGGSTMKVRPLEKDSFFTSDPVGSIHPLVRKTCFDEVGGFWEELPARQDYEMWIRLSRKFEIVMLGDPYAVNYKHTDGQITSDPTRGYTGLTMVYRRYKKEYLSRKASARFIHYRLSLLAPNRLLRLRHTLAGKVLGRIVP